MNNLKQNAKQLIHPLVAIVLGLLAGAAAILVVGGSVTETFAEMWKGAFGNFYFFTNTLARSTPIILVGLGVAVAFRAGFLNMGSEGQMLLGALAASLTAIYMPGPVWIKVPVVFAVGMIVGGLYSAFASWLDTRFRMNLIITTLLLNYIAQYLTGYLVSYPFKDTTGSAALSQTSMLDKSLWLDKLFKGMSVHTGFIIALAATVILYVFMKYTVPGYEIRTLGRNPRFASYGGVKRGRMMLFSMLLSGAFAGLAGTVEILGTQYRFLDGALSAPNYAFTGIMAAMLASSNPIGTAFAAVLLAALQTGGMGVERNTDVPLEISSVIQAVLILFVTARISYSFIKRRKGRAESGSVS
ncbi:Branched-chain amino acid transport system / permease component [compost metagenome]